MRSAARFAFLSRTRSEGKASGGRALSPGNGRKRVDHKPLRGRSVTRGRADGLRRARGLVGGFKAHTRATDFLRSRPRSRRLVRFVTEKLAAAPSLWCWIAS